MAGFLSGLDGLLLGHLSVLAPRLRYLPIVDDDSRGDAGCRWLFGCLVVPIMALIVGIVTWKIVDNATPCHCDGDPDAEWYNSMESMPYGLAGAVLTAATAITLVIVRQRRSTP